MKRVHVKSLCRQSILTALLTILSVSVSGQNLFRGILLSRQDSTVIPFAIVKLAETGDYVQTDNNGEFKFEIPPDKTVLHLEISTLGFHETIVHKPAFNRTEKIYVEQTPLLLNPVEVEGLNAEEIVKKAVLQIPANYTDSSFAAFSFYRQYEKINGEFMNLIEAQVVVSFITNNVKNNPTSDYGFAIEQMRRSNYSYVIDDLQYDDNDFSAMLRQNPVYHLTESSLNPNAFSFYKFSFDTLVENTDDYHIRYVCNEFSSEMHGVSNLREVGWRGESREEGMLTIDRETFAFKKIERKAFRNPWYHYPKNNNYLLPSKRYYEEFVDGDLVAEYQQEKGKWFLTSLCHSYTNEFNNSSTTKKEFTITEVFEWYCDSISHYISTGLSGKFFKDTPLPIKPYTYNESQWDKPLPAFRFFNKEDVYRDLEQETPLEKQFNKNE
ncbi:MAG TPA: hypothetical protein PKW80_08740 [Bacteroidales bacterium]|nr:hypothetical protein [Bacteroidales bacterium]